jgi:hypothetical protein
MLSCGTVNVAVRFALLDEEPKQLAQLFQNTIFVIINPYFPIFSVCGTKTCAKQDCI